MNALQQFIASYLRDNETQVMNVLQDCGIVSDNCIGADSVGNAGAAIQWINTNPRRFAFRSVPKTL